MDRGPCGRERCDRLRERLPRDPPRRRTGGPSCGDQCHRSKRDAPDVVPARRDRPRAAIPRADQGDGTMTAKESLTQVFVVASYEIRKYLRSRRVIGVAYLVPAILKGTITATVLTFFLFFLIFTIVSVALSAGGVQPWFIPSAASGTIGNVLTPPFTPPPPEPAPYIADGATSLAVFAVYFVVSAILATLLFRRRELKS